jgi:hypothetical protein
MVEKLRDQLIGAWKLVSYVDKPVDGSAPFYPMREHPMGIILYTPDGYMSAQLMQRDRGTFASMTGSTELWKSIGKRLRRISLIPDPFMSTRKRRR